jgi:DNA-binding SARP family transcriptional activator/TolB-like protein
MIWLQTFGSAVLYDEVGAPITGAASQRRTLGLLAVLAVAGEAGLTRDKLVGTFWPDVAPRRARHSLTQALYAARKGVNCQDLFEVGEDIRLNPARIASDVARFEARLRAGDDEGAVKTYRGPFLDGIYLQSVEFEMWVSQQRARLEDLAVAAVARLAADHERVGAWRDAVERLRQLSVLRPTDASVAMRLMRALAESGDRAAAIQHATAHAAFVREQYELEPESAVLELAGTLRESLGSETTADLASEAYQVPPVQRATPVLLPAPRLLRAGHPPANLVQSRTIRRLSTSLAFVVIAFVMVIGGMFIRAVSRAKEIEPLPHKLVVAPFRVLVADHELDYLREGIVELLSTRLADDTSASAIDAGSVIRAWRRAGLNRAEEARLKDVTAMARRLGAEQVIVGSVIGTPARAIVSASVVSVATDSVTATATITGSTDTLTTLVDRLAGKLLVTQAGEGGSLAERMTVSLPALRTYLAGSAREAAGDYLIAADHYRRAVAADSGFALAALRLGVVAHRLGAFTTQRTALHHAWRSRDVLSERDRAHLYSLLGARYPAPSTWQEIQVAWNHAAQLAPDRPEVWYGLAMHTIHGAGESGDVTHESALAALRRALELDPNYVQAHVLLASLNVEASDTFEATSPFASWWRVANHADSVAVQPAFDSLQHFGPANLRAVALTSQYAGLRMHDGQRALALLEARATNWQDALEILIAQHSLVMNLGRPADAYEITRHMQRLSPASRAHLRLRVLDAVYASGDSVAARSAALQLGLARAARLPNSTADGCALALWQLHRGDTTEVRATLENLRSETHYAPVAMGVQPQVCSDVIEAALAVALQRSDAEAYVEKLDSLVLTGAGTADAAAWAPIAIARLYRALGQPEAALHAVRRRAYMDVVWPRYLATALRLEGELAAELGQTSQARDAYRRFLALRAEPDSKMAVEADSIRLRLKESQDIVKP